LSQPDEKFWKEKNQEKKSIEKFWKDKNEKKIKRKYNDTIGFYIFKLDINLVYFILF
jgi:hypothetical protein